MYSRVSSISTGGEKSGMHRERTVAEEGGLRIVEVTDVTADGTMKILGYEVWQGSDRISTGFLTLAAAQALFHKRLATLTARPDDEPEDDPVAGPGL